MGREEQVRRKGVPRPSPTRATASTTKISMAKATVRRLSQSSVAEGRPVIVADDSEDDISLLQLAFRKAGILNDIVVVRDGEEVVDYLACAIHAGDKERNPLPALVILDLMMPKLDGFSVLEWMNKVPQFAELPVVIFSASPFEEDLLKAAHLRAVEYLVKPGKLSELVQMVSGLGERWLRC